MNYKRYVLLFNIFFLLLLIATTIIFEWKPGITGNQIKPLDILSDVKKKPVEENSIAKTKTTNPASKKKSGIIIQRDYNNYPGLINNSGKPTALFDFFNHLKELTKKERKKIRIAYFGDSQIEGDLVTQDLRRLFQDAYGGSGVGFVPITSVVAGFRQTISHSFSPNWNDINFKSDEKSSADLFISGHSFFSNGNSVVTYRTVNLPKLDNFKDVSILFGSSAEGENDKLTVTVNGSLYPITATQLVNKLDFHLNNTKEIKLNISSTTLPMYGAAFEADSGIVLDNFSFRGITGIELNYFTEKYLQQIQEIRPYDLLIFHYGPNLLFKPNLTDFSWYAKKMQPTLQKIKNAFPQTSVLLISTADKGFRYDGEWHTAKGVQPLVDAQFTMASNIGSDFFNLFNAMGGEDTIVDWVNADTVLANKDYTHANHRGAKRFAEFIFNAIMKEYKEYEKLSDK